uniref:Putative yellow-related salivary protein n=1 Tax=Nyssomyia neivai TaxID=330878 RepID=A0A1L8DNB3_9DIPT
MENIPKFISLFFIAFLYFHVISVDAKVHSVYNWNTFTFKNLPHKGESIVEGHHYQYYNSCNIVPSSISYNCHHKCLLVSFPRKAHSIPTTLAFLDHKHQHHHTKSPALSGFPSYVHNFVPGWFGVDTLPADDYNYNIYQGYTKTTPYFKSHHFVSAAYLVANYKCQVLYILDTGTLEYPEGNICVRPPILWGFSIDGCSEHEFDKPAALKVTIPAHLVKDPTGFGQVELDNYGNCEEFALYLANYKDCKFVVYDNVKRSFWTFDYNAYNPLAGTPFNYQVREPYNTGVVSLTATFQFVDHYSKDKGAVLFYDHYTKVLFSVYWFDCKVTCWHTKNPLDDKHVVTLYSDLKYGADLTIDSDRNIWFLLLDTNANPIVYRHDVHEYKAQLYTANVDNLIHGTACDPKYIG